MKAIIFKELQENAKWAALMLVGMLIAMTVALYEGFVWSFRPQVFHDEILAVMIFGPCAAALVLGLLQTALETRRDQWAFLMHRGVSASHIYLGKVVAGTIMYLAIVLPPLLTAVVCCTWGGIERFPFEWQMVAPSALGVVAAFGLYFAAMLVAVRQARWYVSRLLPLVVPGLTVLLVPLGMFEISETLLPWVVLVVLASICLMGVAAWGSFIRSGESQNVPVRSRVCLGAALTVAYTAGFLCLFASTVEVAHEMRRNQRTTAPPFSEYRINSRGHVVSFAFSGVKRSQWYIRTLLAVTNIDEPSSKQYEPLLSLPMFDQFYKEGVEVTPQWDGVAMTGVRFPSRRGVLPIRPSYAPHRLLQQINSTGDVTSVFSATRGLIYGYRVPRSYPTGNRRDPKLQWIVGPDGFSPPSARPQKRFGQFLAARSNYWGGGGRMAWITNWPSGREHWTRNIMLFEDGLYEIDFTRQTVRPHYKSPDGKSIRSIVSIDDDRMAIVFDDAIHIHQINFAVAGEIEDRETFAKSDLKVALPGKKLSSIPIPEPVRSFRQFEFGEVTEGNQIVFKCQSLATADMQRFVYMKRDGTVARIRNLPSPTMQIRTEEVVTSCGFAACVPLVFAGSVIIIDTISQTTDGTGPGLFLRILMREPRATLPIVAVIVLLSLFSGWLARRTARRYGFAKRERIWWIAIAVLIGPAGLLSLFCLRDWPLRQSCHTCKQLSPIDRGVCIHCDAELESPPLDGTEILQGELAIAT